MVWMAFIDTTKGNTCPVTALQSLRHEIPWTELMACGDTECLWFKPGGSKTEIFLHENYFVGEINNEWPLASGIIKLAASTGMGSSEFI
jgi:hypothetical protein